MDQTSTIHSVDCGHRVYLCRFKL